jgi:hypothetical protein
VNAEGTTVLGLVPDRGVERRQLIRSNKYKHTWRFWTRCAWIGPVRPNLHFVTVRNLPQNNHYETNFFSYVSCVWLFMRWTRHPPFSSSYPRLALAFSKPLTLSAAQILISDSNSAAGGSSASSPPIRAILLLVDNLEAESVALGSGYQQTTIPSPAYLFLTVSSPCTGGTRLQDQMNMDPTSILFDQEDH